MMKTLSIVAIVSLACLSMLQLPAADRKSKRTDKEIYDLQVRANLHRAVVLGTLKVLRRWPNPAATIPD
jgi:hypothetical protein